MQRLPLLILAGGLLPAADLPVVAVTIHPQGAMVVRAGNLPAEDTRIVGLPAGIAAASVTVNVDGIGLADFALQIEEPSLVPADPALVAERDAARRELQAAQTLRDRALLRQDLAQSALSAAPARLPGDPQPSLPGPDHQAALMAFLGDQATKTQQDIAAAIAAADTARLRLQRAEEVLAQAAPRQQATATLTCPAAAGRTVQVTYRLSDATWEARYVLRAVEDTARLQRRAGVRWSAAEDLPAVPVRLSSRSIDIDPRLPDLQVPLLAVQGTAADIAEPRAAPTEAEVGGAFMAIGAGGGSQGAFAARQGGSKKRALAAGGGTKASESTVDTSNRFFQRQQRVDGSFQGGPSARIDTGLVLLTLLGAGYDHRMPSKYRTVVDKALAWMRDQDPRSMPLPELCLGLGALAEALAISNDPELTSVVTSWCAVLEQRLRGNEIQTWVDRQEAFAGPEILAWASMALKSVAVSGSVDVEASRVRLRNSAALLTLHRDREEAYLARMLIQVFTGERVTVSVSEVQRLVDAMPGWYRSGRLELIHFATMALFQAGGEAWDRWNQSERDFLLRAQNADGFWDAPHPSGPLAATALACLCLEVYYRYAPVSASQRKPSGDGSWMRPDVASQGWPLVWTAGPVTLVAGSQIDVAIDEVPLVGAVHRQAMPILDARVWRRFVTSNPLGEVLPAGPAQVFLDEVPLGTIAVTHTPPGAALVLPLGADLRLAVEREVESRSDDGMRTRTVDVDITYALQAPAGFTGTVEVLDPLPWPVADGIDFSLRAPDLDGEDLRQRLRRDPVWRAQVTVDAPAALHWRLRYKTDLRPFTEFLP